MTFKLNEAPLYAIKKLKETKQLQRCCNIFSCICLIPTFGISLMCYNNKIETNAIIKSLNDMLDTLIIKNDKSNNEIINNEVIEQQVMNTINILKKVIKTKINEDYHVCITDILLHLETRVKQDILFYNVVDTKVNITGYDLYIPSYNTSNNVDSKI